MILVLTTADTEILAVRAVIEDVPFEVRAANPATLADVPDVTGADAVLVRLLGGRRAWERPFDDLRRR